jgi:hypothetical protein
MGNSVSYLADSFTYVKNTIKYIVIFPLKYMSKEEQEMANSGVGKGEEKEDKPLHLKQRREREDIIKGLFAIAGAVGGGVAALNIWLATWTTYAATTSFVEGVCFGAISSMFGCAWGGLVGFGMGYMILVCLDTAEYCMVPIYLKGVELIANDTEKVDISKCWKKRKEWRDEVGLRWALKIEAIDKWAESDNKPFRPPASHTPGWVDYPWIVERQRNPGYYCTPPYIHHHHYSSYRLG